MPLQPVTRGIHEASHLWHQVYGDTDESAVMCTTPLEDEKTAATLFQDLSDPASVSCRSVCHKCNRIFPSEHILQLHITEAHDVIFRSQVDQKEKVYCCLVRGCKKRFRAQGDRRRHLLATHQYTPEYATPQSIKVCKTSTVLEADSDDMSEEEELDYVQAKLAFPDGGVQAHPYTASKLAVGDTQADDLTKAMANLSTAHFVPRAVKMREKR